MPTVSVVIPTYNSAEYLAEAIESVLRQTFVDFEVVVVDDGSRDGTKDIVRRYPSRVRYLFQENKGVASARNWGIKESRGRYVSFLDADDVWLERKLERQMEELARHPGCGVCHTAIKIVGNGVQQVGAGRPARGGSTLEDLLLRGNVVGTPSTVICERTVLFDVAGFDLDLSQCADWDLWIRLTRVTEFLFVDEPLVIYRQHKANMSRDPRLLERDSVRVLEKAFGRSEVPPFVRARRDATFARNYMALAGTYFYAGHYRDFVRCAMRAVSLDTRQLGYLVGFPARAVRRRVHGERPVGQWR